MLGRKYRIADNKITGVKMRKFDRNRDFDPYKCWELGCYNVGEEVLRDEDGNPNDCFLYCNGDTDDLEKCPLKRYIELENILS